MRHLVAMGLAALLLAVTLFGCIRGKESSSGKFSSLSPQEAPVEVRALQESMGAAPGLFVLKVESETYLLLCAGRVEGADKVVVTDVGPPVGKSREVRLLAVLQPDPGAGAYPCAAVRAEGDTKGMHFKARISLPSGDVLELAAISITDR